MENDRSLYGDRKRDEEKVDISSVDSDINTSEPANPHKSLTNDEDADTDPNTVRDKPSFDRSDPQTGRFDGNIGI